MDFIYRLLEHLLHRIGARTLTGFGLLVLLVGITVYGVAGLAGEVAGSAWLAAALALLLGWLAARGRQPGWIAAMWLAAAGILCTGLTTGGLASPLLALAAAGWRSIRNGPPPARGISALAVDLLQQAGRQFGSVLGWLAGLLSGETPTGGASSGVQTAAIVWALALWFAAAWAAWWLRRRGNALTATLPALSLLALSLGYARTSVGLLFPGLATLFGLLAWNSYIRRERGWLRTKTDFAEDVPLDVAAWALLISVGLAGLAATAALPSPQDGLRFSRAFLLTRTAAVERLGESLGLSADLPEAPVVAGMPSEMPRQHLLSGGLELSGKPALILHPLDIPAALRAHTPTLPYLRQAAYDLYTGQGWSTSPTFAQSYPGGSVLPLPHTPGWPAVIEVQPAGANRGQILSPGELLSIDAALQVDWRIPAQDLPADPPDAFVASIEALPPSGAYRVTTWITPADAAGLRRAGQAYPGLITARYLQLPDHLPTRVHSLAAGLTARSPNPYDRALIIEAYLRRYDYRLDLPAPPANRDLVDYFLFDLKAGYCDYNASAMVVLARLAGIPARLAAGYALPSVGGPAGLQPDDARPSNPQPAWSLTTGDQLITEDYAHSWPELYFPGYGWVAFEPTGGRQARQLPAVAAVETGEAAPQAPPISAYPLNIPPVSPLPTRGWWPQAGAGLTLLALVALLLWQVDRLRWRGAAGLRRSFAAMRRHALRLGLPVYPGTTPNELGAVLAQPEAVRLTGVYAESEYSLAPPSREELETSRYDWLRLRRNLWSLRIKKLASTQKDNHL